ncbi:uncharacterized protein LOC130677741 [Microplitis mediator]|uniref:uncharacterized protein LOC130677741 n=1 Tax=Microplitis mediator TaxID=375433 RepID=UPI002553434D|nr:uncharacterized protein LOC130677741 [Microplitis mediator]
MENKKAIIAYEIHKPARRNYQRRHVDIQGLDETWQADLVEMIPYATSNKGYKYLLTVIYIFSKYAWAVPIKNKSGSDITSAMKSVFQQGRVPENLHVDQGKEFYNKEFQERMKHLVHKYNTRKHRTIQLEPIDVTAKNEKQIFEKIYKPLQAQQQAQKK